MRVLILAVGRMKQGPERELVTRYLDRAVASGKSLGLSGFSITELTEFRAAGPAARKAEEAKALAAHVPAGAIVVALDERGRSLGSEDFAKRLARWRDDGKPTVSFVIGGADGLDPAFVSAADLTLGLSADDLAASARPHHAGRTALPRDDDIERASLSPGVGEGSVRTGLPHHGVGRLPRPGSHSRECGINRVLSVALHDSSWHSRHQKTKGMRLLTRGLLGFCGDSECGAAMRRSARWAAVGVTAAVIAAPMALLAQSDSSAPAMSETAPNWIRQSAVDSQQQLAELEASLSLSNERVAALKAEIDAMKGDRDKQNAALIAATERVKLAEADVAAVEQKIGDLIVEELDTRGRLDGADKSISNVLAALERISRNPPPALIVDPSDALGSARSAMLISAILPQLQAKADAVMADLNALNEIKLAAQAEEENLRANFDVLEEEQLRIATLIAARKNSEQSATAALETEEQEAALMAEKAAELKQRIADLGKRADAVATAAAATEQANAGGDTPSLDRETVLMALANPERTEPAVPFASARGFLNFPVSGVNVVNYGDGDGFGGISKGLSVVTRAQAPVIAPADGWVLYAGEYLNYGQIVILDVGQDHTILLAGLEAVEAKIGQFVRMGERLGAMGSRTIGRTVATSAGASNPTLYIEMRNNNSPIDPTGWWASPTTNTTQSG